MIIFSGCGFLVPVITFGTCLAANFVLDDRFGEGFYSSHAWAAGFALVVGGVVTTWIGYLLKGRSDRFVVDEETGEQLVINDSNHSFFFIPMHLAGVAIAGLGLFVVIADAFN